MSDWKDIIEERLGLLEKRIRELESQRDGAHHDSPPGVSTITPEVPKDKRKELIAVECLKKSYHEPSFQGTDVKHRIDFVFRFSNSYKKDIRACAGNLLIKDLFDELVFTLAMRVHNPIKAGGTLDWEGGIEYNYFIQEQVRLNSLPVKDMKTEFVTKSVIFTDGTKQDYES